MVWKIQGLQNWTFYRKYHFRLLNNVSWQIMLSHRWIHSVSAVHIYWWNSSIWKMFFDKIDNCFVSHSETWHIISSLCETNTRRGNNINFPNFDLSNTIYVILKILRIRTAGYGTSPKRFNFFGLLWLLAFNWSERSVCAGSSNLSGHYFCYFSSLLGIRYLAH